MKGTNGDLSLIDVPVPHDQRVETLIAAFRADPDGVDRGALYSPQGIAEAPGRVNLIGEHVDYNDGLVLPFAIDRSVMWAWSEMRVEPKTKTQEVLPVENSVWFRSSTNPSGVHWHGDIGDPDIAKHNDWRDYPSGVLWKLQQELQRPLLGLRYVVEGDVPQGAGLSSSAALEVAIAGATRDGFGLFVEDVDLALLCQRAENEYVGVQCGIMDQFASALSQAGHALLIDCRTLAYRHVPLRLAEHGLAIVIANSAVRRELITSAYNERRRECEEAVTRLRVLLGRAELSSLRDVEGHEIDALEISENDVVLRRARHVVQEIGRVAEVVDALERDDFGRLGELIVESHLSLRDDYAVSSEQLDMLVGLATAQEYVLGARLTGAGFGGCTVNLVRAERVEDFARDVIAPYRERTGLPAVMYVTPACDGLRTWRL